MLLWPKTQTTDYDLSLLEKCDKKVEMTVPLETILL